MKTITLDTLAHPLRLYAAVLASSSKRPGVVKELPQVTYVRPKVVLEAEAIAAYAKVCGFTQAHGVPLLYPQMLTFPLAMAFFGSDDCPWPGMGTVHLANRVVQHARLNAGDVLQVEMRTGELIAHEKGQIFNLQMRVLRDDTLVWEATQTLLRLGVQAPVGPEYTSALTSELPLSHQMDFAAPADIGRRYGKVSGDINPIHLSALSAKLFGFRRAIAHGLWTNARALVALLPQTPLAQAEMTVEFKTPLFLPARASLWTTGEVRSAFPGNALFEVRNAAGDKPHLRGQLGYRTV